MRNLWFLANVFFVIILAIYCQCGESSSSPSPRSSPPPPPPSSSSSSSSISSLGVNWGALCSHPLDPAIVVQMLKSNGIKKVKLFDADYWTVSAFGGTDIEVILGIPNDQLEDLADSEYDANKWVRDNLTRQLRDNDVNIKYGLFL